MDLLGVTEMSVEHTWKASAGEVKLKGISWTKVFLTFGLKEHQEILLGRYF